MGLKRPVYAVLAYMVLVYCKLSHYYPALADMQAELIFAIVILARIIISGELFSRLSFSHNKVNQYLFFFVLCILLSFAVAWDRQFSWDIKLYPFIKVLILYVMLIGGVTKKEDLNIFFIGFLLMYVYLAYEPAYYFVTGTSGDVHKYGTNYVAEVGLLGGHVALANNMNQMIPIALFTFLGFKQKLLKGISLACLIIFVLALIGSGSRGGMAGFAFFGFIVVYFSKNRTKAMILICIPLLFLIFTSGRTSSTISRIDNKSFWGRFTGLTHGISMLQKGNVLGVGPGCYILARQKYHHWRMESHNIYGQVIGDLGIPGTIAWAFFLYQVFKNLNYVKDKLKSEHNEGSSIFFMAQGIQLSLLVRLFVSFASHGLYYFYWYVMAFMSVLMKEIVDQQFLEPKKLEKK